MVNHLSLASSVSTSEVRVLCSPGITRLLRYYDPLRGPSQPPPCWRRSVSRRLRASSPDADHLLNVPCSLPRWIDGWYFSVDLRGSPRGFFPASPWPSRTQLPVGIHVELFEVCSSFTHVTAR